jgi:hypothetical protein
VIVADTQAPTFDPIGAQTVQAGVTDIDWTTYITNIQDNADNGTSVIEVSDNIDYNTPGTYSVTVKLVDDAGNETEETFNVTITDTTAPTFEISNQTIEAGSLTSMESFISNIVENSDSTLTYSEPNTKVDYNTAGTYDVEIRLTDGSGNYTDVSIQVIVADTQAPTFDPIEDQFIQAGTDIDWTTLIINPSDNSDGILTLVEVIDNVQYTKLGTYSVTVKVVDTSGNETSQTFSVTVLDTTPPVFVNVPSQSISIEYSSDFDLNSIGLQAIDNLQGDLSAYIITNVTVTELGLGEHEVIYKVVDQYGNESQLVVTYIIVDTTPPSITDIRPITIRRGETFDIKDYIEVTDNFDLDLLNYVQYKDDITLSKAGVYKTILSVTDSSGNTYEHEVTITVLPVYTPYYYISGFFSLLSLAAIIIKFRFRVI